MEIKLVEVNLDGKHQTSKHKNVDKVSKWVIQQNNTESRNRNLSTSSKRSLSNILFTIFLLFKLPICVTALF